MKKIALFLMMALSYITTNAANGKSLFVTFNDGLKVEFALSTSPEITFNNDQMTIKSTETTVSYELWKVATFTYGATSTGISQVETYSKYTIEGNHITIDGTNNKIGIFTLDGKKIHLSPIPTGDKTSINLNELPHGIYIIRINNNSIKIARQ